MTKQTIRVLVVGCGNMGSSHAKAYHSLDGFEICGLVSKGTTKHLLNRTFNDQYAVFDSYQKALMETRPDAVCISTYPDTHERYALLALEMGCHVFLEKPIADSYEGARRLVQAAEKAKKKLVIGYILRHHPSWRLFIEKSRTMGSPLVMRMNLNQQSQGTMWRTHKNLMQSLSPIVDCGVHYIDVMCQMVSAKPIKVHAIGARLTSEIPSDNYNYGQLQLEFSDGSVGWYEAGWGPMISETAFFIKDVFGPKGSVSIVAKQAGSEGKSADVDMHTKTEALKIHRAEVNEHDEFVYHDEWIDVTDEPDHQELCNREQQHFYSAIVQDLDVSEALEHAASSLKIALACDESIRTGKVISLE